jgi:hypothetical protein
MAVAACFARPNRLNFREPSPADLALRCASRLTVVVKLRINDNEQPATSN